MGRSMAACLTSCHPFYRVGIGPSLARLAALAAAVEQSYRLSPAISKIIEEKADEVAGLAQQLKIGFSRYCEAFEATEGLELFL
jgi:hypothetical protein